MKRLIIVYVLLLKLRRGGVCTTELIIVVAVVKVLHLKKVIVAIGLLVTMLLMHWLSATIDRLLVLLLLSIHLYHVIALRLCCSCTSL
jgi:hypothetical protein